MIYLCHDLKGSNLPRNQFSALCLTTDFIPNPWSKIQQLLDVAENRIVHAMTCHSSRTTPGSSN